MHARGYGAIGVAEICARAEVRKGSFYHFFESKQALTIEAIDAHWRAQRTAWAAALDADAPALDRLDRLFDLLAETQRAAWRTGEAVYGCLLGNLAVELSNREAAVQRRLAEVFDEQIDLIHAALRDAADEGSVPAERADRGTARAVVAQIEGVALLARLSGDPTTFDDLGPQTRRLYAPRPDRQAAG